VRKTVREDTVRETARETHSGRHAPSVASAIISRNTACAVRCASTKHSDTAQSSSSALTFQSPLRDGGSLVSPSELLASPSNLSASPSELVASLTAAPSSAPP
jgi:hypothetical protein